jgi:hypothetical protein
MNLTVVSHSCVAILEHCKSYGTVEAVILKLHTPQVQLLVLIAFTALQIAPIDIDHIIPSVARAFACILNGELIF